MSLPDARKRKCHERCHHSVIKPHKVREIAHFAGERASPADNPLEDVSGVSLVGHPLRGVTSNVLQDVEGLAVPVHPAVCLGHVEEMTVPVVGCGPQVRNRNRLRELEDLVRPVLDHGVLHALHRDGDRAEGAQEVFIRRQVASHGDGCGSGKTDRVVRLARPVVADGGCRGAKQ